MGQGRQLLGEAYVKISLDDLKKLDLQVDNSGRKFMSNFDKMETKTQKLTKAFGGLGGVIATIGAAKLGSDILSASTKMDTMNRMLVNIEGSQAKANKRFEEFRILAKEPVLDPFNLSRFYVGLKSVNVEADLSIRFMKSLANSMAGVGAGNEEFARSMEQVVQMMGKGKLVGQDLRVIAESFPQIRKYLAEAFGGIVDPEELAKKGYTALDVLTKLNEVMEKQPHFAGGAQAAQDNFRQSLVLFEAAIGKDLLPTFSKFLDFLTSLMDKFSAMPDSIKAVLGDTALGGLGLLGVGAALAFIVSTGGNAVKVLKELAGVNIATSAARGLAGVGVAAETTQLMRPGVSALGVGLGAGLTAGTIAITATTVLLSAYGVYNALTGKTIFDKPEEMGAFADKAIGDYLEKLTSKLEQGKTQAVYGPGVSVKDVFGLNKSIDLMREAKGIGYDLNYLQSLDDVIIDLQKRTNDWKDILYETKPLNIIEIAKGIDFESLLEKSKAKFGDITSKEYNASDETQLAFWQAQLKIPLTEGARQGILNTIAEFQDKVNKILKEKADEREKIWFEHAEAISKQEYQIKGEKFGPQLNMPVSEIIRNYPKALTEKPALRTGMGIADREGLTIGLGLGLEVSKSAETREKSMLHIQKIIDSTSLFNEDKVSSLADEWDGVIEEISGGTVVIERNWGELTDKIVYALQAGINLAERLGEKLGWEEFHYKDPELERQRQEQAKKYEKETTKWGHVMGMAKGAGEGWMIGSSIGGPIGGIIGAGIGAIAGYQEGGWVMKPTIALMGEREPELIIPKSKMVSGGFGGMSFGNINVYVTSPTANVSEVKRNVVVAIKELVAEGSLNRAVVN